MKYAYTLRHFRTLFFLILLTAGLAGSSLAQVNIGITDFESTPATPTMTYATNLGTVSAVTFGFPTTSTTGVGGSLGYWRSNGTGILTTDAVNTTGYTGITVDFRLASLSQTSGNGSEATDFCRVEISPDNGTNWYSTLQVNGINNARWSYDQGTATATTAYDGDVTPVTVAPAAGGTLTTTGYSTVVVSAIPAVTQLRVRITIFNNDAAERWAIDNIRVRGTLATPQPEIQVKGNNVIIADNDATPSATDDTEFGSADINGSTTAHIFRIKNTGNATLTLDGTSPYVVIGGSHAADFTMMGAPASSIPAGDSTSFTITFDPSAAGLRTATISIDNTDSDEDPYNFSIQGTGTVSGPAIAVTGNSVAINNGDLSSAANTTNHTLFVTECVATGSNSRTYTITNSGTSALTISSITSSNTTDYSLGTLTPSGAIAASGTATFTVTFDPATAGTGDATITVVSDAVNLPSFAFGIRGTGTATPTPTLNTPTSNVTGTSTATAGGTAPTATCIGSFTETGVIYSTSNATPLTLGNVNGTTIFKNSATGTFSAPQTISRSLTGLTPNQLYYYSAFATNAAGTGYTVNGTFTTAKLEPTNHVTSLTNTAQGPSSLTFTWNDNDGSVVADGYLVRAVSGAGSPTDPTDGTTYSGPLDFTVAHGVQSVVVSGLNPLQLYTIKVYPYTNAGTLTDYKTSGAPSSSGTTTIAPVNIAQWELSAASGSQVSSTGTVATNVSTTAPSGVLSRGAGVSSVSSSGSIASVWGSVATEAAAISGNKYYEWTVTPNNNYRLEINTINFVYYRTASGPQNWSLYSSVDGFTSSLASGNVASAVTPVPQTASITGHVNQTGAVTFRLYAWASTGGNLRIGSSSPSGNNDLEVVGYVTAVPSAPEINVTQAATNYLAGSTFDFGNTVVNTNNDKTFVIENTGTLTLNLASVVLTGSRYSFVGTPPISVAAGSTANLVVRFNTNGLGDSTGTLTIDHDDATGSEDPYVINLAGHGIPSQSSDIIADGSFSYSTNIDYRLFRAATITNTSHSIGVMGFTIRDGGGATDADTTRTILENISFSVTGGTSGINNIRSAALFVGNSMANNTPSISSGTGTISFNGLFGDRFKAPDGGSKTLTLRVTFNKAVTDNDQLQFTIASANVSAPTGTSQFGSFTSVASSTTGDRNRIEVTADRIFFTNQPGGAVGQGTDFTLEVTAGDSSLNRDLDLSGSTVTLTKLTGGGTLTGTASFSITNGIGSTTDLVMDAITTGVTIQAAISPTLAFSSTAVTNSFNVTGVGYAKGHWRTRTYVGQTTNWASASNWEQYNGSGWDSPASAAPDADTAVVHVERSMTLGSYGGPNIYFTVHKLYVKGTGTTLTTNTAGSPLGLQVIGADGELRILSGKVAAVSGIFLRDAIGSSAASTAQLTVDSGATLTINYAADNQSLLWNGVENFKRKSKLEILNWDWNATGDAKRLIDESATRTVSNNANGYKFGHITLNNGSISSFFGFVANSPTVSLCENDLTITNGSANAGLSNGAPNITIGGSVIVPSSFRFFATGSGSPVVTIKGDIQVSGSATLDINSTNSAANPTVNLWGNYSCTTSALFLSNDNTGSVVNFEGNKAHTVNQVSTASSVNSSIAWVVTGTDSVQLLNQDWMFGSASSLTVANGGYLDCNRTTPGGAINITNTATATGTSFILATGGTLVIRNEAGITTAPTLTGNVRLDTRSYDAGANYWYKNRGAGDQLVGNGLATALTGKVTVELASNFDKLIFSSSTSISAPGLLEMRKGRIVENTTGAFIEGNGGLQMYDGILEFNRVGSSLVFPRLTGTYNLFGGTIQLSGNTNSPTNIQKLRPGETYYNVVINGTSSGGGSKTITNPIVITNNLTIGNDFFNPGSWGVTGTGGMTMTGALGVYRTTKLNTTVPELSATAPGASYDITAGIVELIGTSSTEHQILRGHDGHGNTVTYGNVYIRAAGANTTEGNVGLGDEVAVNGVFHVFAPAVVDMGENDIVSGSGNFIMDDGTGLRYAHTQGIAASGATGQIQVTGTRTYADDFYSITGNQTGIVTGNGLPLQVDTLVLEHTGDVTLSRTTTVARKLRFAGAGNLVTGSDTVKLSNTGSLVNESATKHVYGLVQSTRTVAQNATELFGNVGFEIRPTAATPGLVKVTRRTGPGSVQTGNNPGAVSIARVYRVSAVNNSGLNAFVTIKYFESELNGLLEPSLYLFRSPDGGTTWNKVANSFPDAGTNACSAPNVNAFSDWTLGDGDDPLPVTLVSFKGRVEKATAILNWETTSETDNLGFEVERSDDGAKFAKIGFVASRVLGGRNSGAYSFVDRSFPGLAYYRLRQIDKNGHSSYSPIVVLESKDMVRKEIALFPNPAGSEGATLQLSGIQGQVSLSVTDAAGRRIGTINGTNQQASATFRRFTAGLEAGFYLVRVQGEGVLTTLKFERR